MRTALKLIVVLAAIIFIIVMDSELRRCTRRRTQAVPLSMVFMSRYQTT